MALAFRNKFYCAAPFANGNATAQVLRTVPERFSFNSCREWYGGRRNRARTCDLFGVNEAFYQLNYPPDIILITYITNQPVGQSDF